MATSIHTDLNTATQLNNNYKQKNNSNRHLYKNSTQKNPDLVSKLRELASLDLEGGFVLYGC